MKLIFIFILCIFNNCLSMQKQVNNEIEILKQEIEKNICLTYEFTIKSFSKYVLNEKGLKAYFSVFSYPFLNVVLFTNLTESILKQSIYKVIALTQSSILWWKTPSTIPNNIDLSLKECGFNFLDNYAVMYYNLKNYKNINQKNNSIKKISSVEFDDFVNIRLIGGGLSFSKEIVNHYKSYLIDNLIDKDFIVERYLVYINNTPVTCGTLIIKENWAGICEVATLPEFRKNGLASLLTNYLMQRSKELNLEYIILFSSKNAQSMYLKSGFEKAFDIETYIYKK